MSENKTKPTNVSVSDYVAALPQEARRADLKTLINLIKRLTGDKPKMWGPSIVGFGNFHYKYESGREGDMPVVVFSPRKSAIVIYRMNHFPEAPELIAKLGKCKLEGSCLHIKTLAEVDLTALENLIAKSISAAHHNFQ